VGVVLGGNRLCVEFVDYVDVGVINSSKGSESSGTGDGGAEMIQVGSMLGGAVVAHGGGCNAVRVTGACHGHGVNILNVPRENGVDTITDGAVDGLVGALCRHGGSKDKHVKAEEVPPKQSEINGMCAGSGDGINHACLEAEEVGLVTVFKVTLPSGTEVQGVVIGGGQDEGNAMVQKVVGAVFGIKVEEGGTNVEMGGGCWWWVGMWSAM
jgi:hypothetical protein